MDAEARRMFLDQYAAIRHAEGRGSGDPEYYRALPFQDLSGRNSDQWRIRAHSYRCFERVILKNSATEGRPLRILDLGAGNGWLSHRLTEQGHQSIAVDIFTDPLDGLGALRHYDTSVPAVAAEFDRLPFPDAGFDLVIFNSSLHYSSDYRRTLLEARRCLRVSGQLVIIDSPVYKAAEHGERMKEERHAWFEKQYGFRSDALRSVEYLDEPTLARLSADLRLVWKRYRPWYGWRWALRPLRAKMKGQRPPSRFVIISGSLGPA